MNETDAFFMKKALALAKKGMGHVSPNPCVGAVVVRNHTVISSGYHKSFGGPHAEAEALKGIARKDIKSSALYVTLEPCSHFGKTPPCADLILKMGLSRVVIGLIDKNPLVAGQGVSKLREHGVKVETGVLSGALNDFYRPFFKHITTGLPFVTLKIAQSMDGKNSVKTGTKYLLSEKTLRHVHQLRFYSDAIMVGVNTVIADNPSLDIRYHDKKKSLTKVILDTHGRTPVNARIFNSEGAVLIYTAKPGKNLNNHKNSEIVHVSQKDGRLNLKSVMKDLGARGIQNLLVEGGGTLSLSLLKDRLADRLLIFNAPYIIGGNAYSSFGDTGFESLKKSVRFNHYDIKRIGPDFLVKIELNGGKH